MLRKHYEEFLSCILKCKEIIREREPSREASLAVTKLDEAWLWFMDSSENRCPYNIEPDTEKQTPTRHEIVRE